MHRLLSLSSLSLSLSLLLSLAVMRQIKASRALLEPPMGPPTLSSRLSYPRLPLVASVNYNLLPPSRPPIHPLTHPDSLHLPIYLPIYLHTSQTPKLPNCQTPRRRNFQCQANITQPTQNFKLFSSLLYTMHATYLYAYARGGYRRRLARAPKYTLTRMRGCVGVACA
jgi:hypothetical protein